MRTVRLHFDSDHVAEQRDNHYEKFNAMIGRLAMWGSDSYDTVDIVQDREKGDLMAAYTNSTDQNSKYVIGAIWHEDDCHYSFHS